MTTSELVSRRGVALAAAPALAMVVLFYSLAIHMYLALGGWPESIGARGFPPALVVHAKAAINFFMILTWIGMFIVPLASAACVLVLRWRRFIPYLRIYVTACFVAVGANAARAGAIPLLVVGLTRVSAGAASCSTTSPTSPRSAAGTP